MSPKSTAPAYAWFVLNSWRSCFTLKCTSLTINTFRPNVRVRWPFIIDGATRQHTVASYRVALLVSVIQHFLSLDTSVKLSFVRPPLISVIWSYCAAIPTSARSVCSIGRYFETPASRLIITSYYDVFTRFYRRARYCYGTSSVRLPVT